MRPSPRVVLSRIGVVNETRSAVLATRAALAVSSAERRRGLLGRSSLEEGEGLILLACKGIHSFGMKFPIDVAYVAPDGLVTHVLGSLPPNRTGPLVWRAGWVLELPAGVLAATETAPGDRLLAFYY